MPYRSRNLKWVGWLILPLGVLLLLCTPSLRAAGYVCLRLLVVGGIAMNKIEHWQFTHPAEGDDHVIEENSIEVPNGYGFGHDELFTRVSASIFDGAPVEIPADEGLRTLQLLHAFYASDEQGCRVRLADRPESSRLGVMTPGHGRLKPAALRPQTR